MSDDQLRIEPGTEPGIEPGIESDLEPGMATRRRVLASAGAVGAAGAAAAVLAACGTDPNSNYEIPAPPAPPESPGNPGGSGYGEDEPGGDDDDDSADDSGGDVDALAATSDVEVGGGLILADEDLVITRPADGEWHGFSATCTHEGCKVSNVSNGIINCACHGSQYSIQDGSVVGGPAPAPLPARDIAVEGDSIVWA